MRVAKDRNYWIAFIGCMCCTVLTLMGGGVERLEWLLQSDINVALWLLVAWMFDDK